MSIVSNKDFKLFFETHFEPVYRFARKYTEEDSIARDITQDAFIRLYERRSDFDAIEKTKSFVYTTVKNLCLDHLKHLKIKEKYNSSQPPEQEEHDFLHEITYQETLHLLYKAIRELPPQTQEIILQGLEGKNNNEIAESMHISINTVKSLKKSAYKKLKDTLTNDFNIILLLLLR